MAARGVAVRKAKAEAGLIDVSKLKKLSTLEWHDNYTSRAFPGLWARHYNHQYRLYLDHYKRLTGDAPQYRTLCWRAAALSTTLAMIEAGVESLPAEVKAEKIKHDQRLIETIGQLQRYTETEKHETTIRDKTKEQVMQLIIAVADHVLDDTAKPALFSALRRVIAGGELDPAKAISLLASGGEKQPVARHRSEKVTVIDSTSRPDDSETPPNIE